MKHVRPRYSVPVDLQSTLLCTADCASLPRCASLNSSRKMRKACGSGIVDKNGKNVFYQHQKHQ
uniref:Uncharacterized protein n=1 Tax=Physcomitrium patens TaxID=3218 RepID=A0A2K1KZS7_PHYPA|nr:hypothetical protein PHYPA_002075 [Physcomitrium patens]